ncbi:hybrid sensor histidine kinase/response regulator [Polyangium mundeleinium]|uniref:histidine kinase n=1 Tax=Polyangium mundeleinium TaxID=2995306 RepID=A0ABT5EFK8_9BACT|nr:PAS domain S-box protein [Polyangium mundeleinium]MDC0740099.1 PAS domain S-box protein [Polyangium mundeleinium]
MTSRNRMQTPRTQRSTSLGFVVAVLSTATAMVVHVSLERWLGASPPWSLFSLAVALPAVLGGLGPGLLATGLCGLAVFIQSAAGRDAVLVILFFAFGLAMSWIGGRMRRSDRRFGDCTSLLDRLRARDARVTAEVEVLRESEGRFRALAQASFDPLVLHSEGVILDVNQAFTETFGYRREEVLGARKELLAPDDFRPLLAERMMSGAETSYEAVLQRKDGSRFVAELRGGNVHVQGRPARATVIRDLTPRRAAESVARWTDELFRQLYDWIPLGMAQADAKDGRLLRVNACYCEITGYSAAELLGKRFSELTHPDDREKDVAGYREAAREGRVYRTEKRYFRKDGSIVWVRVHAFFLRDVHGGISTSTAVIEDITQRKRNEEMLRETQRSTEEALGLLDNLFAYAPLGIALVDPQCRFVRVNESLASMNGASIAEHVGRRVADVVPDLWPLLEDVYRRVLAGERLLNVSLVGETRACPGESRHWLCNYYPVRDRRAGEIMGIGIVVQDVTDQTRAEEALREADRRKDEFLAMLAHELRNPLAPIKMAVEIQKRVELAEPRLLRSRDVIERQVGHLVRLLDDLLDVSRISRGRITLQKETHELCEIIDQAIESTRPLIDARKHDLDLAPCSEPLHVNVDAARLTQVVANLLNNAAKYTDDGGRIHLGIERGPRNEALIRIKDNGRGIDPKDLPHVFDTFYQSTRTLDRSEGGLGIGLSLVRRLVELHGGRVEAHSEGLGKGSEFVVRLALEEAPMTIPQPADIPAAGQSRRVLVVDDNIDAAETMAALLETLGHEVSVAHDGEAALEAVSNGHPEIVLLDIGLPRMDGYEVCKRLRDDGTLRPFIVAVTGYGQAEDRARALEAGFDAHLVKPASFDAIQAVLRAA